MWLALYAPRAPNPMPNTGPKIPINAGVPAAAMPPSAKPAAPRTNGGAASFNLNWAPLSPKSVNFIV